MRARADALSLLSDPLDVQVLRALADSPLPLGELRRTLDSPPTTLRKHLRTLTSLGLLTRRRQPHFPAAVSYELSPAGGDLLATAAALSSWLAASPDGQQPLGTPTAKRTLKALGGAWRTKMLRALAAKPLALTELDRTIHGLNYPALERRLAALRCAGLVAAAPGRGAGTPYRATRWLRQAAGPLVAASCWEQRRARDRAPTLNRLDVEAIFFLAIPLLELPSTADGSCSLAVELASGGEPTEAGVVVTLERGRPVSCQAGGSTDVAGSARGPLAAWADVLDGDEAQGLELEGDRELASELLAGLRQALRPHQPALS